MISQNKYPLCRDLGLTMFFNSPSKTNWANADQLEAILQKATVVYTRDKDGFFIDERINHTHKGLVISIQPIKQKTTLEKISDAVKRYHTDVDYPAIELTNEIKKLIEEDHENK